MAGFDYKTEEHFHYMELEHEREHDAHSEHLSCIHEQPTGDAKYPVLCLKDNTYARRDQCRRCAKRQRYVDTCSLRVSNSAENCTPGHDCAVCGHYTEENHA